MAALIAARRADGIPMRSVLPGSGGVPVLVLKWKDGRLPQRAQRRERLKAEIARLFARHEGKYGSPRITADLRDAGWRVSENTVAALMREQHLAARRKRRRRGTTRPGRGRWRAPDLVKRDFPAAQVNKKWYGDGTEIRTGEGKLYLASVLDMASRRILGFALGEHHDAQLACSALAMAVTVPSVATMLAFWFSSPPPKTHTPALMASWTTSCEASATAGISSSGMWSIAWAPNEIRYRVIP